MECKLCTSEIDVDFSNVKCGICDEIQNIGDLTPVIEFVKIKMSEYKGNMERLSNHSYNDTHLTKAIDEVRYSVYQDCMHDMSYMLENILNQQEDENYGIRSRGNATKSTMCQMDSNKICNGCMDC